MAAIRTKTNILFKGVSQSAFSVSSSKHVPFPFPRGSIYSASSQHISTGSFRCFASSLYGKAGKKPSARLSQLQQLLLEAEEDTSSSFNESTPKIGLEHVNVSFVSSGAPVGRSFFKVDTRVDMRFNVKDATWLNERIRWKIMHMEKNRMNKNGELVISSKVASTHLGNVKIALSKLQKIVDAAAYVPPPPTEEQMKIIALVSSKCEQERLLDKKGSSCKAAF